MKQGWIGVDFDGTLVTDAYPAIGEPVPAMVARVKQWLREGREVRIVTARVAGLYRESQADIDHGAAQVAEIEGWCFEHIGRRLPVQAHKDYGMVELWDDRAVQVIKNTGERADEVARDA